MADDCLWQQLMNSAYDKWQKNWEKCDAANKAAGDVVAESWPYARFLQELSPQERRAVILDSVLWLVGFKAAKDSGKLAEFAKNEKWCDKLVERLSKG